MTAAEGLLDTLPQFLTCSVSLIASAHPSPLRFLFLPPALRQEGRLATSTRTPVGQLHRGDLSFGTKVGRAWAQGCEQGKCTVGQGDVKRKETWRMGLGGEHQAMGWDTWDGTEGNRVWGQEKQRNKE